MSDASKRGRDFELKIAKMIRHKLGVSVERDRRSGAGVNKQDISDWSNELPIKLELKDQKSVKVKEWMQQAIDASAPNQVPTMAFAMDSEIFACLRFSDLLDFLVEIKQLKAEIAELRIPVKVIDTAEMTGLGVVASGGFEIYKTVKKSHTECRNGHLCDENGYCQTKACQFSRGYRIKKQGVKK